MCLFSIIWITILLTICIMGIFLLFTLTERNTLQKKLMCVLSIFFVLILYGLIDMVLMFGKGEPHLSSPLSLNYLIVGFIAFFATASYYMAAAHRNRLTTRNSLIFLSPVIITIIAYFVWHMSMGVAIDYKYSSLEELWDNRYTVPVILRMLMFLFFIIYQTAIYVNIWKLNSLRDKYSILNSPDAVSNIRWLRMVILGMLTVTVCFTFLLFFPSHYTMLAYSIITAIVFLLFINNAISHPMYSESKDIKLTWNIKEGWEVIEKKMVHESTSKQTANEEIKEVHENIISEYAQRKAIIKEIKQWMDLEKPYLNPNFTPNDLVNHFTNIDKESIVDALQWQGENNQSYIRRCRIEEACKIVRNGNAPKVSDLAEMVGFTHQTSFSRAFSAVTNETPLHYINKIKAKNKATNKVKQIRKQKNNNYL